MNPDADREKLETALRVARIQGVAAERRRIIGAVEEVIGRPVCDGGQYRADLKAAIEAALEAREAAALDAVVVYLRERAASICRGEYEPANREGALLDVAGNIAKRRHRRGSP